MGVLTLLLFLLLLVGLSLCVFFCFKFTFGDIDIAFNVDHYIGSDEADIFFGSNENDTFDAASGSGNYMSGGAGEDELLAKENTNKWAAASNDGINSKSFCCFSFTILIQQLKFHCFKIVYLYLYIIEQVFG